MENLNSPPRLGNEWEKWSPYSAGFFFYPDGFVEWRMAFPLNENCLYEVNGHYC